MKRMMITAVFAVMCCGITACTDNKTADTGTDFGRPAAFSGKVFADTLLMRVYPCF
ncbi:MAG: hypothetical protein II782_10885 [Oscillospiraceae bacterium]|nr:hypothetical protein [Oscillospiraceae bacterium]